MSLANNDKMIIFFDGVCNMCIWYVQFIISKDTHDVFRFASLQSSEGKKIISKHSLDMNSIILLDQGRVKTKSSAVFSILYQLDTIWRLLLIFYFIPYPIRDFLYHIVVKTRYCLFGKRDKCMVPNKNINSKFLYL